MKNINTIPFKEKCQIFSYFSMKTYVMDTYNRHVVETPVMNTTRYVFVEK